MFTSKVNFSQIRFCHLYRSDNGGGGPRPKLAKRKMEGGVSKISIISMPPTTLHNILSLHTVNQGCAKQSSTVFLFLESERKITLTI